MSIQSLIRSARKTAKLRGHNLAPAKITRYPDEKEFTAFIKCRDCSEWVQCKTHPLPNEIDIGGTAVALSCKVVNK